MNKFSKIFLSTIAAAFMLSFATVSAGAADYGVKPNYPAPSNPTVQPTQPSDDKATTDDKSEDTAGDVEASTDAVTDKVVEVGTTDKPIKTVTEETITNAIAAVMADDKAEEVVIYVAKEKAVISEAAIGEIAKNDVVVTLKSENCTVTIDPALITKVKKINLAMDISVVDDEDISSMISELSIAVPAKALVIAPAQKGDFGMTVTVTVSAETVAEFDADNLFFYYISDDGEIEDLSDALSVNDDGSVSVSVSHASQYLVIDEQFGEKEEEVTEIEKDDESDGKTAEEVTGEGESNEDDDNPGTGVTLFGAAALAVVSATVVTVTAKKRK